MEERNKNLMVADAFRMGCDATAAVLGERLDAKARGEIMQLLFKIGSGEETLLDPPAEYQPDFPLTKKDRREIEAKYGNVPFEGQTKEACYQARAEEIETTKAIWASMNGVGPDDVEE